MLRLDVKISRLESTLMLLVHLGAVAGVWLANVPDVLRLPIGLLIVALAVWQLARIRLWTQDSPATLFLGSDCVRLASASGVRRCRLQRVAACGDQWTLLIFSPLTVELNARFQIRRVVPVLLLPDSITGDQHRRLRAWLRFGLDPQAA